MRGGIICVDKLCIGLLVVCASLCITAAADADSNSIAVHVMMPEQAPLVIAQGDEVSRDQVEIIAIKVEGLTQVEEQQVLTALTIKEGDILVGNFTSKLNAAADALYNAGWFSAKPELTLDTYQSGAILNVKVQENPQFQGARISGNTLFTSERLLQEVDSRMPRGAIINARKLIEALDAITQVYHDAGYIGATAGSTGYAFTGPEAGIVDIEVSEGIIEEVIVRGLEETSENVVYSQLQHLQAGSVLTRSDLEMDYNAIYNTGLFETVNIDAEPSLRPGYLKILVDVTEAATGQAGFGLGYSTVNGLQGTLSYNEKNLFGSGKELAASLIFSRNKPGFEINYSDPYYTENSFWNVGVFNLQNRQQRAPGTAYESELVVDTQGFQAGYGQRINDYDSWMTTFSTTEYDFHVRKGDPFRGYSPARRARLSAEGRTNKVGLTYSHDTRNNKFRTTEGYLAKGTLEYAGLGGDFNFNKITLEGREFYPMGPGTLAFRQRIGFATGEVPIFEEYRLGGVSSIRGVSEDLLTGTHSWLSNAEYRYQINRMFGAAAFVDYGAAGESFSDMDTAMGAGIGARISIPELGIGAVRLDYGWELQGEDTGGARFHFFLGEMF
jgi:outer membrane protein insertion porin family